MLWGLNNGFEDAEPEAGTPGSQQRIHSPTFGCESQRLSEVVSWIEEGLGEARGAQGCSGLTLKQAGVVVWGFLHPAGTPAARVWVGEVGVPI